ncbi:MAG: DUF1501 domain-containing protein [Acidobacteriota bacterium]
MEFRDYQLLRSRRKLLSEMAGGIGALALGDLFARNGYAASGAARTDPLAPKAPHFPAKAKNVIFLFMEGGPSQMDLLDPKPELKKYHGQAAPASITSQLQLAFTKPNAAILASSREFKKYGKAGLDFSDWLPNMAQNADDMCIVRSMYSEAFNHHPAQLMLFTGTQQFGRPTMGAWTIYGLGSESENLPGFVVLSSGVGTSGGASNFSSGFLPSTYQGTPLRSAGDPILYLSNPKDVTPHGQRAVLDAVRDLNQQKLDQTGDVEIAARMASYELAFRMQTAGPELTDFAKESPDTLEMYGINDEKTKQFGTNCLLARRLVERGVRFIMLMDASWDSHTNLNKRLGDNCAKTDRGAGALIKDLKQRGLLDSTLVVWGGEFGRTPVSEIRNTAEADNAGRDHHPLAYSMWLSGGGIKGGQAVGKTDDLGFFITEDKVHIHDLQATMMHCLGFDHTRLTYRFMGRDFRLTDVEGSVVKKMLA